LEPLGEWRKVFDRNVTPKRDQQNAQQRAQKVCDKKHEKYKEMEMVHILKVRYSPDVMSKSGQGKMSF